MSDIANSCPAIESSSIKKGMYIVMNKTPNERPCKSVEIHITNPGKHGPAKVRIVGIDIFTGKKYETVIPGSSAIRVPIIIKKDYQLMAISDDNYLGLMDDKKDLREDFELPEGELGVNIKNLYEKHGSAIVCTTQALGHEKITGFKIFKD